MKCALIIGHSQEDGGAVSVDGINEYKFNNEVAHLIKIEENRQKCELELVWRKSSYHELPYQVNLTKADFAVELHFNCSDNIAATGTEVLYWLGSEKGFNLAVMVQNCILEALGLKNRGIKPITISERGGHLLKNTIMPCVIAEPFFGSNKYDWETATKRKNELAQAYLSAIELFAEHLFRAKTRQENTTQKKREGQFR